MEHKGTKTIETHRLLLRKFCAEDINAAYMNWTSDDRVTEFLRWPTHTSKKITETVIKGWIKESEKPEFVFSKMQTTPRIGFWLDNSNQTPQQTAENILNARKPV